MGSAAAMLQSTKKARMELTARNRIRLVLGFLHRVELIRLNICEPLLATGRPIDFQRINLFCGGETEIKRQRTLREITGLAVVLCMPRFARCGQRNTRADAIAIGLRAAQFELEPCDVTIGGK